MHRLTICRLRHCNHLINICLSKIYHLTHMSPLHISSHHCIISLCLLLVIVSCTSINAHHMSSHLVIFHICHLCIHVVS
jgi:hypothetical protein